jgi:hypothetical protein
MPNVGKEHFVDKQWIIVENKHAPAQPGAGGILAQGVPQDPPHRPIGAKGSNLHAVPNEPGERKQNLAQGL